MMKITPESNVGYLNLNAYSDGRIEELTLHVGSGIPREESLFKDGAPNQPWICTDIERILDAPDEQHLCVQYTCTSPELEGWTVLSWGASVDGEWRNGKSYKASYREATRVHTFSMRMDAFRNMLHLSWDAKVDSIQLSAYNEARILDIWFSDEKVEDAGDSKKDKLVREGGYSSPNRGTYDSTTKMEGIEFPQKVELGPWQWGDLEGWDKIVRELKEGVYLIIEYSTEDGTEPNLQFTMSDGKQQGVTPTYVTGGQAVFSYQDIQGFLPDYLIPQEIGNMQVSSGDGAMSVGMVKVVQDNTKLEEEPIAVLTNSWSGYSTQISKWHSDYQVGDTVKVTAKFDKRMPVAIAFNIGGIWDCGNYAQTNVASRTAKPTDDYLGIQLGEMPKSKRFLKIMDIQVEIVGKKNFNECVEVKGSRSAGILASTKKEAATAVLSTEEINQGTKVLFNIEKGALSQEEKEKIAGLFAGVAAPQVAMVSDITVYKKSAGKEAPVTKTSDPVSFKVPLSNELLGKGYDFAVVRFHSGEADFLEDLDGNKATVTFASDKFSKFAIVYGEEGAFDGQSGAIKVFRGAWEGWQTSFSQYNSKFKPGKATKVTLTFDSEVKAYVDYNGPDWTRVEGQGTGKTYMATVTPSDDSLTVGLGDLNGNSKVKLLNVKVEQEAEKITSFTGVDQKFETSFSAFYEKFVTGRPVTVKLTFDKDVVGCVSYHKGGTLEEIVDSGSETGKVLVKTFTPGNDRWNIWIANMNGNETVDLADIEVSQAPVPPIHTFTHSWGGGEDTYSKELSALCKEYEVGDTVKVTAVFDKSSQVKIMVGQGGGNNEITATGARVSLTATPGADRFRIQAGDDGKLPLGLLDVTVEVVKKGDPVEGIHRFMETYAGFETAMSQYNAKFQAGKETTVTLVFDKEVEAQVAFKTESSGRDVRSGSGKEIAVTATPKEDYLNIQIKDMKGNPAVNLLEVKVEQKTPEVTPIFTFTGAWGSDNSTFEAKFSDYMEGGAPFQAGVETMVKLTFDQPVGVKVQGNNMDSEEASGGDKVAQVVVTPSEDKFSVQVKEVPNGKVNLLAVEVSQPGGGMASKFILEEEPVYVFTDSETAVLELADYSDSYEEGQGVAVELNLFSDGMFRVLVEESEMTAEEAKAAKANPAARKRLSIEASPSDAAPLNLATPSNAAEKDEVPVYESDADGVLSIKWEGKPGSGAIAVTILEMDGTQVNIDTMEVEEKDVVKAVKDTLASTAKKIAQLVLPDGAPNQKKKCRPWNRSRPKKKKNRR